MILLYSLLWDSVRIFKCCLHYILLALPMLDSLSPILAFTLVYRDFYKVENTYNGSSPAVFSYYLS